MDGKDTVKFGFFSYLRCLCSLVYKFNDIFLAHCCYYACTNTLQKPYVAETMGSRRVYTILSDGRSKGLLRSLLYAQVEGEGCSLKLPKEV